MCLLLTGLVVAATTSASRTNLTVPRDGDGHLTGRAGRPDRTPTLAAENRHNLGPATTSPQFVSGMVLDQQVLIGDVALPWQYWLDPAVAQQVDEATVHATIAEWSDLAGSRWRSSFAGTQPGGKVADGRSTIFMEQACEGLTTANSYLYSDGGLGINRYGTQASQILEADIGICPRVPQENQPGMLARAIRHEMGHVIGFAHLCDPGDECWTAAMGPGPHGCRVMFWQARECQNSLTADDRVAVATLYPTLRPLAGPGAADTTARVSFAMFEDGAAPVVVIMDEESDTGIAPAAAALAANSGGPFLVSRPDSEQCLTGSAAGEANRTLARRGTLILVGRWPASCRQLAYDWDLRLVVIGADDPVGGAMDLAALGPTSDQVIVTGLAADGVSQGPDAVAATGLAATRGAPVLVSSIQPVAVMNWLAAHAIRTATVVGGNVDDLTVTAIRTTVPSVEQVLGATAVDTALQVADLDAGAGQAVVLVAQDGPVEALAAAVVAASRDAVVVLSPPQVDPRVLGWLAQTYPAEGWTVGPDLQSPLDLLAAYGALVGG